MEDGKSVTFKSAFAFYASALYLGVRPAEQTSYSCRITLQIILEVLTTLQTLRCVSNLQTSPELIPIKNKTASDQFFSKYDKFISKRFDWEAQAVKDEVEWRAKTVEALYPRIPNPPLPLAASISSHAGIYREEGYGTYIVECKEGKLVIDATDRSWRVKLLFTHVSREFFTVEKLDVDSREKTMLKAEFRLDVDCSVGQLGIAILSDHADLLIWFRRVLPNES
ncbi:hypothetical protein P152DRAFT_194777 [Eremomyces bilateralis CBS 781.70]|uniref:Peptidase S12 Pab87-related C-terminal domain-containing protein n=1 Tax=Eremomyces bilateralis CBS 781.70 TaxID=1392243 RepID=A0A6G1GCH3_9PEZI|nr:uncharacterized protein P152DRAFT_194777 [Eremomyces bilateralis CBS 781.70]KAF1815733.1 hypothetical protein P152DRAFT_194777 [Eremomyces bilateralis CBS 781.70]